MAQRTERPLEGTVTPRVKLRYGNFAVGASGAVGTKSEQWFGVVRNSAGNYTLTFDDKFVQPLYGKVEVVTPSGSGLARLDGMPAIVNGKHAVTFITSAIGSATAADPASGSTVAFAFAFKDTLAV